MLHLDTRLHRGCIIALMFHCLRASLIHNSKDTRSPNSQSVARLESIFASKIVFFEKLNSESAPYLWHASPWARIEPVQTTAYGASTSKSSCFKRNVTNLKKSKPSNSTKIIKKPLVPIDFLTKFHQIDLLRSPVCTNANNRTQSGRTLGISSKESKIFTHNCLKNIVPSGTILQLIGII